MRHLASICFLASSLVGGGAIGACSSSSTNATPAAVADDAGADASPAALGAALVSANNCHSCHGPDLSGSPNGIPEFPTRNAPNLTPDKDTGVGGWSDDDLVRAIRTGIDDEDKPLCSIMPRFVRFTDTDVANVVAYLRSLPAVSKEIPDSECPTDIDGGTDAAP